MTDISVVIPVGPDPVYLDYLPECIESIRAQIFEYSIHIVLINDGADLSLLPEWVSWREYILDHEKEFSPMRGVPIGQTLIEHRIKLSYWKTPWNVGVADAFNFGIALSPTELVFMLGSDDKMMPTCLEEVVKEYEKQEQADAWYNVTIVTESGEEAWIPNNTAAVTKGLWKWLGGYPPAAGVGACDALALSILMKHAPEKIIQVKQGTPLCWLREGPHQDTRKNMGYYATSGVIEKIREMEMLRWSPKN